MKKTLAVGLVLSVASAVFAAADRVGLESSEGTLAVTLCADGIIEAEEGGR